MSSVLTDWASTFVAIFYLTHPASPLQVQPLAAKSQQRAEDFTIPAPGAAQNPSNSKPDICEDLRDAITEAEVNDIVSGQTKASPANPYQPQVTVYNAAKIELLRKQRQQEGREVNPACSPELIRNSPTVCMMPTEGGSACRVSAQLPTL